MKYAYYNQIQYPLTSSQVTFKTYSTYFVNNPILKFDSTRFISLLLNKSLNWSVCISFLTPKILDKNACLTELLYVNKACR